MDDLDPYDDLDEAQRVFCLSDNWVGRKRNSAKLMRHSAARMKRTQFDAQSVTGPKRSFALSRGLRKQRPITLATKPYNPKE